MRPGLAVDSAPTSASLIRIAVAARTPTAAGGVGFHDRPARGLDTDVLEHAMVERDRLVVAVDEMHQLQRQPHMPLAARGHVVRGLDLRVGACEIEMHVPIPRLQPAPQADRDAGIIVVVEVVPEHVVAVRDQPLHLSRLGARIGNEVALRLHHRIDAVRRHEFEHALFADLKRCEHGLDVAEVHLRRPAVGAVEGQEVLVHHPSLHELHRWDLEPLLEQFREARRDAGRNAAANIGGMDEIPGMRDDPPFMEDRPDQVQIRHVGRQTLAEIGVVGDDDVAGPEIRDRGQ